ncbi:hypothetical protein A2U01_0030198, partial [Trifolium medium]|nr:hypothetical protein [Trifolium medium]
DKLSNMQSKEQHEFFNDWNSNFFKPANYDVEEVTNLVVLFGFNSKGNNIGDGCSKHIKSNRRLEGGDGTDKMLYLYT